MKRAAFALLVLVIAAVIGTGAGADAPSTLQVYDATSAASPLGIITKVPAETDGGVVFASSTVELGKTQATAAAATLGPLGDAFLTTSVPNLKIPEFVTAQYPPSPVFPAQATANPSVNAGPITAVTFHAAADGSPASSASATGGSGGISGVLTLGTATATSESHVAADGTVATTARSTVSNIVLGPLTITSLTSTATVTVPLGGAPKKSLTVEMAGVLLGGVPITITQNGISIAGTLPVPATSVATLDQSLGSLRAIGISLQAVPVISSGSAIGASVTGAALQIGYGLPLGALPALPTDIGTNETILLGEVTATADARVRQPLSIPPSGPPSITSPVVSPVVAPATPVLLSPQPAAPVAVPQTLATPPPVAAFSLPKRISNVAARRFLHGYELFIVGAILVIGALLFCIRTRLFD